MTIYTLDFEECLKNYKEYHVSLKKVNEEKEKFTKEVENIKKEMESIISQSRSFLLDDATKKSSAMRFQELQEKAIRLESDFRSSIVEMQNSEVEKNFNSLNEVIQKWVEGLNIDMLLNKNQVIFSKMSYDATSEFIQVMKDREIYEDFNEDLMK
jgi:Skp family chaperone for outer membrane proteins